MGGGVAVLEDLRAAGSGAAVLALSVSDAAEDVVPMIRAGALGYEIAARLGIQRADRGVTCRIGAHVGCCPACGDGLVRAHQAQAGAEEAGVSGSRRPSPRA